MTRWSFFTPTAATVSSESDEEQKQAEQKHEEEEEQKMAEQLFLRAIEKEGKFEEIMAQLDHEDDTTVQRLLGWAIAKGKPIDAIRRIGERCGGDISGWTLGGFTAIQMAVRSGNVHGIRELLRMGADINRESGNESLRTALHWAVYRASLPCVEVLLEEAGLEVDATNDAGSTALHLCSTYAAANEVNEESEEVVAEIAVALIRRGANMNKGKSAEEKGHTPLWHAIENDRICILTRMLQVGEKPPAPVAERLMEKVRECGELYSEGLDVLVRAGWGPRIVDDAHGRTAAPIKSIPDAVRASPTGGGSHQRSSGSSAQRQSLPLHDAAKSGNVDALAEHLSSGADINAVDKHGGTALHAAAMHGHDGVVEALLRADGIIIDKADMSKLTALYRAAVADQVGAVKALLKAGASPHAKDQKGTPLLHKVVTRPAGAVLEALLARGALPGAGVQKGWTALHVACTNGASGTVEALLRAGALPGHCWNESFQSPLVFACRHGNLNGVQQLLRVVSKRQINMRTGMNAGAETPLGAAIRCSKLTMDTVAIVEALLEAGADPQARTGPTHVPPLAWVLYGNPAFGAVNGVSTDSTIGPLLVKTLVAGGADVNQLAIDQIGFTPLQLACFEGACGEVVQALLDAGADMLAPCLCIGWTTPLVVAACHGGNTSALRVLIDQPQSGGLNGVGGQERDTPLAAAVQGGQTEVVRFLLEEGADMDLLPYTEDGKAATTRSLIEMAAWHGHLDIMRLLIQAKMFKDKAEQQREDANAKGAEEVALC